MLINFLILFQLIIFEDYKNLYEELLKNKERCDLIEKKLENIGKDIDLYTKNKEILKAKKLLRESHNLSAEYTNCRKEQKIKEKKLKKLLPEAKIEIENEIEKVLALKTNSREKVENLSILIDKLKLLEEANVCPILSFKKIEIKGDEPPEVLRKKEDLINSILSDIKREEENSGKKLEELKKEKALRENIQQFLRSMEIEGGGALLDVRISSENMNSDLNKLNEEIENCEKAIEVYRLFQEYWNEVLKGFKEKGLEGF